MSYDVSLVIDTGAGNQASIEVRNVTYNNGCIFAYLGIGLRGMEGQKAGDLVTRLDAALAKMATDRDEDSRDISRSRNA